MARFFPQYILAEHFQPCSLIAYWHSSLMIRRLSSPIRSPSSRQWEHLSAYGWPLPLITSSLLDDSHSTSCLAMPAATDELTLRVVFTNQRCDFHCRLDVHRRHLHPGALRCPILSATFMASTFRFRPSPTTRLRFNFAF